jgi:hypothetical protein
MKVTMTDQRTELQRRFLQVLAEMSNETMWRWLDDPQGFQDTLQQALCQFKFLMTIRLGTGLKTTDDFCQAITDAGGRFSDWAKDIMGKPDFANSVSPCPVELDLYTATTEEILGEKGKSGSLSDIYAGIADRLGGELLPAEAGPQSRLQYLDQPDDELLLIAMEPIKDSGGDFDVFGVRRDDNDLWLNSYYNYSDSVWSPDTRWVFSRPRCA